jgi:AraC-like DNA-binding protein
MPRSDGAMTMESFVQLPALPLRSCIAHYAGGRASGLPVGGVQAGLPSRHAHLIISLAGPIDVVGMPDPHQSPGKFQVLVSGLQGAPAFVSSSSHIDLLHLFIKPLGMHALLGLPCAELFNRVVALSDLWGDAAVASLLERLHSASTSQARCAVLDGEFLRRLGPGVTRSEISWVWQQLMQTRGNIQIQRMAATVGWSRRHLSEQFSNVLGISPKAAARILRFEHACRVLMDTRSSLAEVAARCGFQDQAHMTHEWKALAGSTPRIWLANELPFLQDYELASGDDEHLPSQSRR